MVIDGPAVLNWTTCREVDAALPDGGQSLLRKCLRELMGDGIIHPLPIEALVHLLSGRWMGLPFGMPKATIRKKPFRMQGAFWKSCWHPCGWESDLVDPAASSTYLARLNRQLQ
jgi:hypothetical protein